MNLMNTYINSENKELVHLYFTEASKQGYTWCDGDSLTVPIQVQGLVGIPDKDGLCEGILPSLNGDNLKELTLEDFNIKPNAGRKIIQLIENPDTANYQGYLTALCDDGTVWFFQGVSWTPLGVQIPQDDFSTIYKENNNEH